MAVERESLRTVVDDDELSVAGEGIGESDRAVVNGAHRDADGRRNLDPVRRPAGRAAEAMTDCARRGPVELAAKRREGRRPNRGRSSVRAAGRKVAERRL